MDSFSSFGSDYGVLNSKYTVISYLFGSEYPFEDFFLFSNYEFASFFFFKYYWCANMPANVNKYGLNDSTAKKWAFLLELIRWKDFISKVLKMISSLGFFKTFSGWFLLCIVTHALDLEWVINYKTDGTECTIDFSFWCGCASFP